MDAEQPIAGLVIKHKHMLGIWLPQAAYLCSKLFLSKCDTLFKV
jgi:hypothetical protein